MTALDTGELSAGENAILARAALPDLSDHRNTALPWLEAAAKHAQTQKQARGFVLGSAP